MTAIPTSLLQLPVDDTLSYRLLVSKAVPRGDVTVTVGIELILTVSDIGADIDPRIRSALHDFIPVTWELLGQERTGLTPGYERLSLKALAKVPAQENHNLDQRARQANRDGLEFGAITVKRALPQAQVNQVIKELWFEAVAKVNEHLPEFNQASGRVWRIGNVVLGVPDGGTRPRTIKGGYSDDLDDTLSQLLESGLSGVEKIRLVAEVTLKSGWTAPD